MEQDVIKWEKMLENRPEMIEIANNLTLCILMLTWCFNGMADVSDMDINCIV